ncbi:MAG: hypothetical protein ACREXS_20935 [Gammaproteobacteria bacterium]
MGLHLALRARLRRPAHPSIHANGSVIQLRFREVQGLIGTTNSQGTEDNPAVRDAPRHLHLQRPRRAGDKSRGAGQTQAEAQALEDGARALDTQAAGKQGEADTLRQAVVAHRSVAEGLDQRAGRDRNATRATLGKGLSVSAFPLYVPV